MKTIPETFMHEGRRFELERRSEHAAIYRQMLHPSGKVIAYETHRIRRTPARPGWKKGAGTMLPACERLGSNNDFGFHAWSFSGPNRLERAIRRFNELNNAAAAAVPVLRVEANSPQPYPDGPLAASEPMVQDPVLVCGGAGGLTQ